MKHITYNINYYFKIFQKDEGAVSIILSVLILGSLLVIGSGVSFLMIQQARFSSQVGESVIAFYAANAGAEKCLYQVRKKTGAGCDVVGGGRLSETINSTLGISFVAEYNGLDKITSRGEYRDTNRAVQLDF